MKHVVVWDPENEYWGGAVVPATMVGELRKRGVCTLPCEPELFHQAGFAGFAKREWGAGWPFPTDVPGFFSPFLMYYPGEPYRKLHWAARIVGEKAAKGASIPLRIAAGDTRGNVIRPVLNDVQGRKSFAEIGSLGEPDSFGGWTVGGEAMMSLHGAAVVSLGLYGCGRGMRVAWVAATLIS